MTTRYAVDKNLRASFPKMLAELHGVSEEKAREIMSRKLYPSLERWQDYF